MKNKMPFAVFDIDGTLVRWQLYHAVADALAKQGIIDSKTYVAIRDARMKWKQRTHEESFKDYEKHLVATYEKLLTKLTTQQFEAAAQTVFEEYKDQVYTYTRDLIKTLKGKGYTLLVISGSQTEIVQKIASYYGFDDCVGSDYHQANGRFTGQKTLTISAKDKVLQSLIAKHHLSLKGSIAVGDSTSDIVMLEVVEQPIAFNPEKKLFEHAKQKGWQIVIERKNMVYKLEPHDGTYLLAQANY